MNSVNLTLVIMTSHWNKKVERLCKRVYFAREVIVLLDAESAQLPRLSSRIKILHVPLANDFSASRNKALQFATSRWVWFIDDDEWPDDTLLDEVYTSITLSKPDIDGFRMTRKDIFLGMQIQHGEAGACQLIRLGKRTLGKWHRPVHEVWQLTRVENLKGILHHQSHKNLTSMLEKIDRYSMIESNYRLSVGASWSFVEQLVWPVGKFAFNYIWLKGFLDGKRGLYYALAMSWHSWLVRYRLIGSSSLISKLVMSLFLLLGISLSLGHWQRMSFSFGGMYVHELLMAVLILLAYCTGRGISNLSRLLPIWKVGTVSVLLLSFSLALAAWRQESGLVVGLLYLVRLWLYWWFSLSVLSLIPHLRRGFSPLRFVQDLGFLWLVGGIVQWVFSFDLRHLYLLGWDDHYGRMVGAIWDPNFYGILMLMWFWLLVFKPWFRKGRSLFLILTLVALFLTYSRSTLLILIALGGFYLLSRARLKMLMVGAICIVFAFLLPIKNIEGANWLRSYSVVERIKSTQIGWQTFVQHPWWGVGFNRYTQYLVDTNQLSQAPTNAGEPDNSLVWLLATGGLFGALPFISWYLFLLLYSRRFPHLFFPLMSILIHSLMNQSLLYPFASIIWLLLVVDHTAKVYIPPEEVSQSRFRLYRELLSR